MKRKSDRSQTPQTLRVWTLSEAQAAAPFIASIVRSMREHALEALAQRARLKRLNEKPGRPTRQEIIAQQETQRLALKAEDEFQGAAEELQNLDIFSLDPLQGSALVPFVHEDQLGWYIFDLFDSAPFRFWRLQSAPEETRRHVAALPKW